MQRIAQLLTLLPILLASTSTALSQKTWIVDAANGAGTNFTDIPAAVTAASSGDIVIVRKGLYLPPQVSKGLRFLGEAGATIQILRSHAYSVPVEIRNLKAGEVFLMRGFRVMSPSQNLAVYIDCSHNAGSVIFEDVTVDRQTPSGYDVRIQSCSAVTFHRCQIRVSTIVTDSSVTMSDSVLRSPPGVGWVAIGSRPAIFLRRSDLSLSACNVFGADGDKTYGFAQAALQSSDSVIRLTAGRGSRFEAGKLGVAANVPALLGNGKDRLILDPAIVLVARGSSPTIQNFGTVTKRTLPALSLYAAKLGATTSIELRQSSGSFWALQVAAPGKPLSVLSFGSLWCDWSTLFFAAAGIQDASGITTLRLNVPNQTRLRGAAVAFQTVAGKGSQLEYSNVVNVVVH